MGSLGVVTCFNFQEQGTLNVIETLWNEETDETQGMTETMESGLCN